ncbi:TANK-binding kinase 1-binding protein 1 [Protopterus annectens]|uniref:TANK-binding kinase 1-binding protein 1 n=1 Tax=Protopterus annectens TaxID=7888 RepID=UPI001CFBAA97|nr:TANK-binding kinase 1-binding protein 1 [Protopterus annectens]
MDSLFDDDISIIERDGLCEDGGWVERPINDISGEMFSASHFALITAYDDIKNRLTGLERENSTLKRKLKQYENKYTLINESGNDRSFSVYTSKESSLLRTDNCTFQHQINHLQQEFQKSKEREDDLFQAYQKVSLEKNDLQQELNEMTTLAEKHLNRVRNLEQQLRQRESTCQVQNKEVQYLQVPPGPEVVHMLDCGNRPTTWNMELQRLKAELEGADRELQNAQRREDQLKEECERLQSKLGHLQETRQQEVTSGCDQREMEWIKRVGDEQVNLALAYTELSEELSKLKTMSCAQSEILRKLSAGQVISTARHSPVAQHRPPVSQCQSPATQRRSPVSQSPSPASQRRSPVSQCPSPATQRRSPVLVPCQSPATQRRSPAPQCQSPAASQRRTPCQSPAPQRQKPVALSSSPALQHRFPGPEANSMNFCYPRPSSHFLRASFQGRRSYSEVSDTALYQQKARAGWHSDVSTLPKHRPYHEVYLNSLGGPIPKRDHRGFGDRPRFEKQSSDEDEWVGRSPSSPDSGPMQCATFCASFPIPESPANRSSAACSEHAQSWPSINLWMETEGSDIRSCPLCHLTFPVGYPDDALIKHIDSHLENSKI